MHVITRKRLRAFGQRHPDAASPLENWYRFVRRAHWQSLQDVRRVYPHADLVTVNSGNPVTVFNISGNKYRLITAVHYNRQRVYILRVLSHAEYNKEAWKETL
jgi:mRNA interferase HigB